MRPTWLFRSTPLALVACLGCSSSKGDAGGSSVSDGGDPGDTGDTAQGVGDGGGHVLVQYPGSAFGSSTPAWVRFEPVASASPQTLGSRLDALSPGSDQAAGLSRDGQWVALVTTRFDCQSGGCLAVARVDGTKGALVKSQGTTTEIDPEGRPAIASGGALVVYPASGGPHAWDLYAVTLSASGWSAPLLLTADMEGAPLDGGAASEFAHEIGLSYDGKTAVFECGPSPYQTDGADVCVTNLDGSGTRVAVSHLAGPSAADSNYTHMPDYAPDGTVVFEADWLAGGGSSERIWRFTPDAGVALVTPAGIGDDNSPCVFPDGRIASLWLPNAIHELKVMNADGSNAVTVETTVDIDDVGQSCGL
jgi:hypothetical protein